MPLSHKFKIGQLVDYFSCERASGVYEVTQLLPPEGDTFQYRIKKANEPHERVVKEHELDSRGDFAAPPCATKRARGPWPCLIEPLLSDRAGRASPL
jgi:hypothetical protein